MVGWSKVITSAMTYIDDVRWREELLTNKAIFFRSKVDWVKKALGDLNRPPELYAYLTGGMTEPVYDDYEWTSTETSTTEETVVQTGKTGFGLCSVGMYDADGTHMMPYDAIYDSETGDVTFPMQTAAGIRYSIDFYTDGTFPNMTVRQMDLFASSLAVVWDTRFDRNFLNIQAKVHDSAFNVVNEGNYTEKINQRLMRNTQLFRDKLNKYEQDCAYAARFKCVKTPVVLV